MGNSATKEHRPVLLPSHSRPSSSRRRTSSMITGAIGGSLSPELTERPSAHVIYSSRNGRGSRPDLSFLGIGSGSDRDIAGLDTRRETKQEREVRKAERERIARENERERSMREESVDGGYLVTQGVYTGTEDYNKPIVRQLMVILPHRRSEVRAKCIIRLRGGLRPFGRGSMTILILGRSISWLLPSEAYRYLPQMRYRLKINHNLPQKRDQKLSYPITITTT